MDQGPGSGPPTVARYAVLGRLASGGMGDVWLARAQGPAGFEKVVVLKTIRAGTTSPRATEMFLREARLAALLSHPNCVQVFELGEVDGGYFIVMEYIDGMSLGRVLRRGEELGRPIPVAVATRIAIDAAQGLEYAHTLHDAEGRQLGLVHRDVSLENLIVTFSGQTKVVDFGIAKAMGTISDASTERGTVKGKVGYMAPEYLRGAAFAPAGDLFALGVVLYRALTGKRPFDGETEAQVFASVLGTDPLPVTAGRGDVPLALAAAIARALDKDPQQRFESARAMRAALAQAVPDVTDSDGVAAYMTSLWSQHDHERVVIRRLITETSRPPSNTDVVATESLRRPGSRSASDLLVARVATPTIADATRSEPLRRRARARWIAAVAAAGVAALGVASAVVVGDRAGHEATAPASAPGRPIEVLVADFHDETGEPLFAGAIESTLGMALEEAPFIACYPRAQARRAAGSRALDEATARKIANHEGIAAIATGEIARTDHGFALSVRVIDAVTGKQLAEARTTAAGAPQVVAAAGQLAVPLRRAMGDTTPEDVQRAGIAKFTSSSLEAVHLFADARDLQDDMDPEAASRALQRVLELDPTLDAAYPALAACYLNLGESDKARAAFQAAFTRIDGMSDRQRFITRGMYYATQGDPHKALEVYQHMLERFPDDRVALRHLAQTYGMLSRFSDAVEIAKRTLARYPEDLRVRANLANYSLSAGDFATAQSESGKLIALQPANASHLWIYAAARYFQGQPAEATATLEKMRALPGGASQATVFLAELALAEGRTRDAIALVDPTVAADLEHHDTFGAAIKIVTRAHALVAQGDKIGAIAAFDRATAVSTDPNIAFEAGRNFVHLGQIDKAKAIAAQLGQHVEELDRSNGKVLEGELAQQAGHPADAIAMFTAAQQLDNSWIAAFDLGRAYVEAGAYPQAHEALSSCVQRRGELGLFVSELAPVYYYLGRAQEGLKSPAAADSYRAYVTARGSADADLLIDDARRRLAAVAK